MLDSDRYQHTLGVAYTAAALAMRYRLDPERLFTAGLLHDCAKNIPNDEKYALCKKYKIKLNEVEKKVAEKISNGSMIVREYVNPNANDEPKRKHILVVDDDSSQLLHIKDQLREFYEVTLVSSGDSALKYLINHRVDLILLDYLMPDMNGPVTLENIRMIPELEKIPVVFLTGVTEKDTVVKTLVELKPQGYIVKPSKKSELVAKIIDILG